MINRRQLVCTAGTALFAGIPKAFAATYDLIIRGGRVIDPSIGLDAVRDVAISGSRIAVVEAGIASDATETIDGNFVAALKSGNPLCCSADQALDTVRLLEAIGRSAVTGEVVRLV